MGIGLFGAGIACFELVCLTYRDKTYNKIITFAMVLSISSCGILLILGGLACFPLPWFMK